MSAELASTGSCDPWGCGSNTARVNGYPVGPLHLGGRSNEAGVSLEARQSYARVHPGDYRLDVVDGELVARDDSGAVVRSGRAMEGSVFVLQQAGPDGEVLRRVKVVIAKVAVTPLFPIERAGDPSAGADDYVTVYEFQLPQEPNAPFLCPQNTPWGWHGYSGPKFDPRQQAPSEVGGGISEVIPTATPGHYALLIRGETYNAKEATVALHGAKAKPWFNIACAGTALSKMLLMGYDPEERRAPLQTRPAQRQATLKMLTARYCPERPDRSYTGENQPLSWQNSARWIRSDARVGDVEAVWNEDGAICLGTPRRHAAEGDARFTRELVVADDQCPSLRGRFCVGAIGPRDEAGAAWDIPSLAEWVTALNL